jgi:hypothetical protein
MAKRNARGSESNRDGLHVSCAEWRPWLRGRFIHNEHRVRMASRFFSSLGKAADAFHQLQEAPRKVHHAISQP